MPPLSDLTNDSRTYLLIPSMPTPNGRLHLGHVAGPFLKLDVIARHLRTRGAKAYVMSGVDCYESYVFLQAEREGRAAAEIAAHYTQGIIEDLRALQLDQDGFIDPQVAPGKELYDRSNVWVLNRLVEVGAASYRTQRYPYSPSRRSFIPRSFIVGRCPGCGVDTAGSVCEACGHQHGPDELIDARLRDGDTNIEWVERSCLVMSVADKDGLMRRLEDLGLPPQFREILKRHIYQFGAQMELTIPGDWGVPWRDAPDASEQIVFTYCTPYPWAIALGELYRQDMGAERNAFDKDSDVVSVVAFGIDITVAFVFGTVGFAWEDGKYKAYDHYLSNEFLKLHGDKFSTSRGHAISGTELVNKTPATSDAIRYYLATISPDTEETDFHIDEFIRVVNEELIGNVSANVEAAFATLTSDQPAMASDSFAEVFHAAFARQVKDFELAGFHLQRIPSHIRSWSQELARVAQSKQDIYWYLKAFCVVAHPLMPRFAGHLWSRLGCAGAPTILGFSEPTRPEPGFLEPIATRLSRSDLASCLPKTLRLESL